ncbi:MULTISPECIES: Gfo/Idh/MocA family oxidoreductase [unclassified Sphingobacterium]|uniref:Gfo/Idh/MocA family oxidoreductase n=1 Tax=unclassified Sphingobacterium TaxID=2609468 RepID=UPI0025EDC007|nr:MULTISPECIES: Gfo/Idh/MocA family oxidoreductase [unclassified Sphingobacterium]
MNRKEFLMSSFAFGLSYAVNANNKVFSRQENVKKIGIIGLDITHAVAFTRAINTADSNHPYGKFRVVAAYPYGSKTIPLSIERIPKITAEVQQLGVSIVSSIAELLKKVDYVLLETNDGNLHLEQALQVIKAKKPLFIDKPIANSYVDAFKIFETAKNYDCSVFSSSSLRYINGLQELDRANIIGADVYCPAVTEPSHKDLYWYGIHGVEMLFALMGPGCRSVRTVQEEGTSFYVGDWSDGRIASLRGIREGKDDFGGTVFLKDQIVHLGQFMGYGPLLDKILTFFETGVSPVDEKETLAICAFIDAAEESKLNGGKAVLLQK